MKLRVFIDTNVFIYSFEYPKSNSAKIIELINKGKIEAVVSNQVIKEIIRYFQKYHNLNLARLFRRYILGSCIFIPRDKVVDKISEYRHKIKGKDLEQLAVVKKFGIKHLIAYDKDFKNFEEYITPKKFIKISGLKEASSEF